MASVEQALETQLSNIEKKTGSSRAALTRAYLAALEAGAEAEVFAFFHDEIEQIEWPNLLAKAGAKRDLAYLKASFAKGMKVIANQRYDVKKLIADGDEVAFEAVWTATLQVPIGSLKAGDTMTAYIASFLTFRDGLIVSQRSYDCFEPF